MRDPKKNAQASDVSPGTAFNGIQLFEIVFFSLIFGAFVLFFPMKAAAKEFQSEQNAKRFQGMAVYTGEQNNGSRDSLPISGDIEWKPILDWSQQNQMESD